MHKVNCKKVDPTGHRNCKRIMKAFGCPIKRAFIILWEFAYFLKTNNLKKREAFIIKFFWAQCPFYKSLLGSSVVGVRPGTIISNRCRVLQCSIEERRVGNCRLRFCTGGSPINLSYASHTHVSSGLKAETSSPNWRWTTKFTSSSLVDANPNPEQT